MRQLRTTGGLGSLSPHTPQEGRTNEVWGVLIPCLPKPPAHLIPSPLPLVCGAKHTNASTPVILKHATVCQEVIIELLLYGDCNSKLQKSCFSKLQLGTTPETSFVPYLQGCQPQPGWLTLGTAIFRTDSFCSIVGEGLTNGTKS